MKIYNESKTEILETYDLEKGYLKPDKIFKVYHEAVQASPEVSATEIAAKINNNGGVAIQIDGKWYEVVNVYDTGKDVREIKPIPAVLAKDGYEEYEDIQVYVPYTSIELKEREQSRLRKKRETECFSVINRGKLWYDRLNANELHELQSWYTAWLDVTETLIEPIRPTWIDLK